ncbi:hypothetical protein Tco_0329610, partial [Tanacetum coccineum]
MKQTGCYNSEYECSTPHFPDIVDLADAVKAMLLQKSSPPASMKGLRKFVLLVVARILTTNVLPPMETFFQNIEIIFKVVSAAA